MPKTLQSSVINVFEYKYGGNIRTNIFDQRFAEFIATLDMAPKELRVYKFLAKKPMTIKQLEKHINVSERMMRIYIHDLIEKNFIKRSVVESKRLKYVYTAAPSVDILRFLKSRVASLEKTVR
ncbi:MAG: hypothetical protein HZB67_03315 [Candidatus Aenigmarchaeota archaeon]|nr:hypothetical protein [Candidatus Aenigmarchaeota archaeon]